MSVVGCPRFDRLLLLVLITTGILEAVQTEEAKLHLSTVTQYAVVGQPYRMQCDLQVPGTYGALIFKLGIWAKCSVERMTGEQFTGDRASYTCEAGQTKGSVVTYYLDIKNLTINDTATPWVCELGNKSNELSLNAIDPVGPDTVTLTPVSPVKVLANDNVTLTCNATCIPKCQYQWVKVNTNDLERKCNGCTEVIGQERVLGSASSDRAGNYMCIAVNPASKTNGSATVEVSILYPPELNPELPFVPKLYVAPGNDVNLTVHFRSFLAPTFKWSKLTEGKLLPLKDDPDDIVQTGNAADYTATLQVRSEEEGEIYCVTGSNSAGQTSVFLQLLFPPEPAVGQAVIHPEECWYVPLGVGLGAGAGAVLIIALIVATVGCARYRRLKNELERPYATMTKSGYRCENEYQDDTDKHYQELPTPKQTPKLMRRDFISELSAKELEKALYPEYAETDCNRNSIVEVGKAIVNPVYCGINPYEIPLTPPQPQVTLDM